MVIKIQNETNCRVIKIQNETNCMVIKIQNETNCTVIKMQNETNCSTSTVVAIPVQNQRPSGIREQKRKLAM